jgi:DNA-binding response OmpR family regulator
MSIPDGSCFPVSVPTGTVSKVSSAALLPSVARARANALATVLVIDDDEAIVKSSAMLLRTFGYTVLIASGSVQACRQLLGSAKRPDILLCDYHLDGDEKGVDAIRALRTALNQPVPAVLLSGDTSTAMTQVTRDLVNCRLMYKPFSSDELLAAMESLLADNAQSSSGSEES